MTFHTIIVLLFKLFNVSYQFLYCFYKGLKKVVLFFCICVLLLANGKTSYTLDQMDISKVNIASDAQKSCMALKTALSIKNPRQFKF